MDAGPMLVEHDDRWVLPYRGDRVTRVRVGDELTLLLRSGATVTIAAEALLTYGPRQAPNASSLTLRPESHDLEPAWALVNATILSPVAFKSGALRLVFDTGHHLDVRPYPDLEAWSVTGPGAISIVCRPGSGPAVRTASRPSAAGAHT